MKQKKRALIFLGLVILNMIILGMNLQTELYKTYDYLAYAFLIITIGGYCAYTSVTDYLDDKRELDIPKVKGENVDSCDSSED